MKEQKIQFSQLLSKNKISMNLDIDSLFIEKVKVYTENKIIELILSSEDIVKEQQIDEIRKI